MRVTLAKSYTFVEREKDLSGKWKVTEGSLSGQWERQRWFLTKAFAHVFGISKFLGLFCAFYRKFDRIKEIVVSGEGK